MSRLKTLVRNEAGVPPLAGGHALCQGCGVPLVVRTVLEHVHEAGRRRERDRMPRGGDDPLPGHCMERPLAARRVRERRRGRERRRKRPASFAPPARAAHAEEEVAVVVFAGDGGTYDIGLQALSGALERGHRLLFVCYDNEAYMNTGIQRSGATPFGASTTTSPSGEASFGKAQQRKDMTAIAVAHHVPYAAQATASHWHDLSVKVERAAAADGPAFLNVLTDCPVGWGHEPRVSLHILNAAVDSLFWPLYEVVDGRYRLTYQPDTVVPIEDWLRSQKRFAHLLRPEHAAVVEEIQRRVDADWEDLLRRCQGGDPA